ncbi:MAG: hypothetical protein CBC84_003450 [Pelagibacteraceae bacterium TMED124]|nr:hypothetical protein [Rickettsiales bacterium]RPG16370.1 MAG: hypothetical protein CBC84_003450 [Pelagibacteraceae bacterium TMED124]
MKIFFIFFFIFFSNLCAEEISFLCKISEELENGKPAKKKNYEQTPISLYLDKNEKWFNDFRKKDFFDNEKDLIDKISYNFMEQKKNFIFRFLKYQTEKKKKVESSSFIKLSKFDGLMSFLKTYYDINEQAFFTTEVRGICNEE